METRSRPQYALRPRLPAALQDGAPAFLVDPREGLIVDANGAAAHLGLATGARVPASLLGLIEDAFRNPPGGARLARVRPPHALRALTFRGDRLADGAVIFVALAPAASPPDLSSSAPAKAPPRAPALPLRSDKGSAPLRFNFETDGHGHFLWISPALADALGAVARHIVGATCLQLEAEGLFRGAADADAALKSAQTFSGVRLIVTGAIPFDLELGGVPLLGSDRALVGVRGFGIAWPQPAREPPALEAPDDAPSRRAQPPEGDAPAKGKVVPLRGAAPLTASERSAFQEIARTLSAAVDGWPSLPPLGPARRAADGMREEGQALAPPLLSRDEHPSEPGLLDRLPVALLVQQNGEVVHANGTFRLWTGYADLDAFAQAGGLAGAFERDEEDQLRLVAASGARLPVEVRLLAAPFHGHNALVYVVRRLDGPPADEGLRHLERAKARREALHLVPWPILLLEADGLVLFANAAAARLLESEDRSLLGESFLLAIAFEDRPAAAAALAMADARPLTRRLLVRTRSGGTAAMHAAFGLGGTEDRLVCLVLAPVEDARQQPPQETAEAPGTDAGVPLSEPLPAAPAVAATPVVSEQDGPHLAHLARLLSDRLAAPLALLLSEPQAGSPAEDLPPEITAEARSALREIRAELDDLAALAAPAPPAADEVCDLAQITREALAHLSAAATRRSVRLRADLPETALVRGASPRLARLVRLMVEDALQASPASASVGISLDREPDDSLVLSVNDMGPALDEVAVTRARHPLRRVTRDAGPARQDARQDARQERLLRLARLEREAEELGGALTIQRGLSQGLISRLRMSEVVRS